MELMETQEPEFSVKKRVKSVGCVCCLILPRRKKHIKATNNDTERRNRKGAKLDVSKKKQPPEGVLTTARQGSRSAKAGTVVLSLQNNNHEEKHEGCSSFHKGKTLMSTSCKPGILEQVKIRSELASEVSCKSERGTHVARDEEEAVAFASEFDAPRNRKNLISSVAKAAAVAALDRKSQMEEKHSVGRVTVPSLSRKRPSSDKLAHTQNKAGSSSSPIADSPIMEKTRSKETVLWNRIAAAAAEVASRRNKKSGPSPISDTKVGAVAANSTNDTSAKQEKRSSKRPQPIVSKTNFRKINYSSVEHKIPSRKDLALAAAFAATQRNKKRGLPDSSVLVEHDKVAQTSREAVASLSKKEAAIPKHFRGKTRRDVTRAAAAVARGKRMPSRDTMSQGRIAAVAAEAAASMRQNKALSSLSTFDKKGRVVEDARPASQVRNQKQVVLEAGTSKRQEKPNSPLFIPHNKGHESMAVVAAAAAAVARKTQTKDSSSCIGIAAAAAESNEKPVAVEATASERQKKSNHPLPMLPDKGHGEVAAVAAAAAAVARQKQTEGSSSHVGIAAAAAGSTQKPIAIKADAAKRQEKSNPPLHSRTQQGNQCMAAIAAAAAAVARKTQAKDSSSHVGKTAAAKETNHKPIFIEGAAFKKQEKSNSVLNIPPHKGHKGHESVAAVAAAAAAVARKAQTKDSSSHVGIAAAASEIESASICVGKESRD